MRILHVHWAARPVTGGVETHLHALVAAQRAQGLDVRLLAGTRDATDADFHPLLEPGGPGAEGRIDVGSLIQAVRTADVLHLHNPQWHRLGVTAALLAGLDESGWRGLCLLDVHNVADCAEHRKLLGESDRPLIAHSAFVAANLADVRRGGEPVRMLPLALPEDQPGEGDPLTEPGGPSRRRGVPVVLQPSRLSAWKGSHHSLTAALDLLDGGEDLVFAHAGCRNLLWDAEMPGDLLVRAQPWRAGGAVRLVHYPPEHSWQAMRAADLVLHPTIGQGMRGEPYSMSVAQAVVLGKPVLATESGNLPNLLGGHEPTRLVPPDDPGALATALKDFLVGGWPEAGSLVSGKIGRRVGDWHAGAAAAHLDLYRRLITGRRGAVSRGGR
jgi:glycosyltransferase involved in cell wall biosynthesis